MPRVEPTLLAAHLRRIAPGETPADAELVGRYAGHRDAAAFEVLVWRHGPMVWATCRRILRHQQDVEDAFQATFLALARAAGTLGTRPVVAGWLHRVAVNAAINLKARLRTGRLTGDVPAPPEPDGELSGVVDEELDRLPRRARAAFVLCCLEGMTSAEAARELGCPAGTVDSRLHAARARLRERLTRRGFGPGALAGLVTVTAPLPARVAAVVRVAAGAVPSPVVAAAAAHAGRIMTHGARTMKGGIGSVLVMALAGMVWAVGGPASPTPAPAKPDRTTASPVPRLVTPAEGQIVLWRDGRPVAINPGTRGTTPLGTWFEGKPGTIRLGPDGKGLIYLRNRDGVRPSDREKWDRVYVRDGAENKEIAIGDVSSCQAFWGSDGAVYGSGLAVPERKRGDGPADPPVDLTADFVNWSFHPPAGARRRLKLPGNISILDRTPDGKVFLVLRYDMPPGAAPGGSGIWADARLGLMPVQDGEFVPLTKRGESTAGDFRFSPDGRFALGRMYRKRGDKLVPELVTLDLKTKARTAVEVPKDAHVHASCWSPNGKQIAFVWEPEAAYTARMNRFGPVDPAKSKKPVYTVRVANPDGSDAKDVYTESEYGYGSIDWSAANFPADQLPEKSSVDKQVREGRFPPRREGNPRELLYPDKPGPKPIIGRLTVNSHAMKQDTQVFSVGLELDNTTGREAILQFDPKDLKLELLDAKGKVIEEGPSVRSGPAPIAHKATLPTSGYVGISTYRGGIGLTPKTILLAAGWQAWVLKPGTYRVRGTATVSVTVGGKVLDPEKPEVPESKPGDPPQTLKLELIECQFQLKMDENAPDR